MPGIQCAEETSSSCHGSWKPPSSDWLMRVLALASKVLVLDAACCCCGGSCGRTPCTIWSSTSPRPLPSCGETSEVVVGGYVGGGDSDHGALGGVVCCRVGSANALIGSVCVCVCV